MKTNNFLEQDLNNSTYAIIEKDEQVHLASWQLHRLSTLNELEQLQRSTREKIIFITPFCLATTEKWYDTHWNEPILAMEVNAELVVIRKKLLDILPNTTVSFWPIQADISDTDYEKKVESIIWEIKSWNINQMVFSRKFSRNVEIDQNGIFSLYKKLLEMRGQYMTFLFHTPEKVFLWATPEKHLCISNNVSVMNPIAGTLWKGEKSDFFERFIDFLNDKKEIWELWMVIDEEIKMMMKISNNGYIEFPLIKETGVVIHTEAELIWNIHDWISCLDALKETLYAPTLVWWPIKSAFSQIAKYENESREYYWWVFWILWHDFLDSAIVIRTAYIDKIKAVLSVRAWAWIVNDSVPEKEAKETILKSNWFFWALEKEWSTSFIKYLDWLSIQEKEIMEKILLERKNRLSKFYFSSNEKNNLEVPEIKWKEILFINSWDDFVYMSAFMIQKMWWVVTIVDNEVFDMNSVWKYDIVVLWPWYGDINDKNDERMIHLLDVTEDLIKSWKKVLWICLWHQAICKTLWYEVMMQNENTQWVQKEVEVFWKKETMAFYNSFSPVLKWEWCGIETFFDDRILTLNIPNISSTQAHPESIMSIDWFDVLKNMVLNVLKW